MKKLFYCLAFVATTLTFTACGGGSNNAVPDEVKKFISYAENQMKSNPGDGMNYVGTEVKGKTIIFNVDIDERMVGISVAELKRQGAVVYMQSMIRQGLLEEGNPYDRDRIERIEAIRKNQYTVQIHAIGRPSGDSFDVYVSYKDLPDMSSH